MKRGTFEALFISALAYTVIASAAMPTRAQETVVYPVRPMEERNVDSLVDKARRAIYTQIRALAQEERIGRANHDAADGDNPTAYEDSGDGTEDLFVPDYEPAEAEDTGAVEDGEAGADTADPVLTEWQYYGNCRITFYDTGACCCGDFANGYTANGEEAIVGWTCANGALPFGTMVMIDGQVLCVTDRGVGADEFDILVGSHEEAEQRGLYYADVYILN